MIHEIFLSFILSERFITLNLKIKNLVFFFSPLSKSSIQTYLKANRCPIQFMHFLFKKIKVLEFFAATVDIKGASILISEPLKDHKLSYKNRPEILLFESPLGHLSVHCQKQLTFHH